MPYIALLIKVMLSYVCLADISPPAQGVDHRQVQKELGDVIVRLHNPVVLTPTTVQVTWTVKLLSCYLYSAFSLPILSIYSFSVLPPRKDAVLTPMWVL